MCGKLEGERMCSHKKKTVNDDFAQWLEKTYGQHEKVKVHHGKVHEYLVMKLACSEKKKHKIDMKDYVRGILDAFSIKFKKVKQQQHQQVKIYLVKSQTMTRNWKRTSLKLSYNNSSRIVSYKESKARHTHRNCISVYMGS